LLDAIIVSMGLEYESFTLGLSFDLNTSSLKQASKGIGDPEVALMYELPVPSKRKRKPISCPRFD